MYTFERSRLITTKTTTTTIALNETKFLLSIIQETFTNNLPASNSGRTLSEILAISHPDDLESYTIHSAAQHAWKKGVVVTYSYEDGVEVSNHDDVS